MPQSRVFLDSSQLRLLNMYRRPCRRVMSQYMWRIYLCDVFTWVIWLIPRCGTTHSWVCRIDMDELNHPFVWHDAFACVTHSYGWHDWFIHVTWLMHVRAMTHTCTIHDSFIRVTWLIHLGGTTHSYVWRDWIGITWGGCTCARSREHGSRQRERTPRCKCLSSAFPIPLCAGWCVL